MQPSVRVQCLTYQRIAMEKKTMIVKVVDTYSGRTLAFRVEKEKFRNSEESRFGWATKGQWRRITDFFGLTNASYCKVFTPEDAEYYAYYTDNEKK